MDIQGILSLKAVKKIQASLTLSRRTERLWLEDFQCSSVHSCLIGKMIPEHCSVLRKSPNHGAGLQTACGFLLIQKAH